MCKTIATSKLKKEKKKVQARLSPEQEIAAFIALLRTFTLIHRNLMKQCTLLLF